MTLFIASALGLGILFDAAYGSVILTVGLLLAGVTLWAKNYLTEWFLGSLGILLVGYAFLGRTFAYIGIPPLFVGEMVLGLGMLAFVAGRKVMAPILRLPLVLLLVIYALWGCIRTIPYLETYGITALRDGVIWGYFIFSVLIVAGLYQTAWTSSVPSLYSKFIMPFLIWVPVSTIGSKVFGDDIPLFQGFKPGDAAVHLTGIATFLILGIHQTIRQPNDVWNVNVREWSYWVLWLFGFFLLVTQSRSSFLMVVISLSLVFLLNPVGRWGKPVLTCLFLGFLGLVINIEVDIGDVRKVSPRQALENVVSILSSEDVNVSELKGTKEWRLNWWEVIIQYTFGGEYFWLGKGFGVNLADADGFQVIEDGASLRSPHNGHLTILARAGVPGFILWVLLQIGFAIQMVYVYVKSVTYQQDLCKKLSIWVLAYWCACMINSSFDVYLEGPQGGIWFWSVMGVGFAVTLLQKSDYEQLLKEQSTINPESQAKEKR
ncbi:O-antigen ligase family protein [Nitrospira sp. M1]